ncbi:MAG: 3'-5' exonuclease, partial [Pseudomonadota bacterium]
MNDLDLDSIAHTLNQHEDYRVIRRFVPKDVYHPDDGSDKLLGVFLDVETTGLDSSVDKVIELALLPFEFSPDGKIFAVH